MNIATQPDLVYLLGRCDCCPYPDAPAQWPRIEGDSNDVPFGLCGTLALSPSWFYNPEPTPCTRYRTITGSRSVSRSDEGSYSSAGTTTYSRNEFGKCEQDSTFSEQGQFPSSFLIELDPPTYTRTDTSFSFRQTGVSSSSSANPGATWLETREISYSNPDTGTTETMRAEAQLLIDKRKNVSSSFDFVYNNVEYMSSKLFIKDSTAESCPEIVPPKAINIIIREGRYRIGTPETDDYANFDAAYAAWTTEHAAWTESDASWEADYAASEASYATWLASMPEDTGSYDYWQWVYGEPMRPFRTPEPVKPVKRSYYAVQWDEVFFPRIWDEWNYYLIGPEPEPKPSLFASRSWIYSGDSDFSPWYALKAPELEGEIRVVNMLIKHYRSKRFGGLPTPVYDGFGGVYDFNGSDEVEAEGERQAAAGIIGDTGNQPRFGSGGLKTGGLRVGNLQIGGLRTGGLRIGGLTGGGLTVGGLRTGGLTSGGLTIGGLTGGGLRTSGLRVGGLRTGGLSSGGLRSGGLRTKSL